MLSSRDLVAGRYRVLGPLGSGGLADAYRARDEARGGEVCVKLLHAGRDAAALWGEFSALARLSHPGLVRVHDFGLTTIEGARRAYLTADVVAGVPLDAWAKDQPRRRVHAALASAVDALRYLHGSGLCHGDVKPANILVDPAGRGTLIDLSCARPIGAGPVDVTSGTPGFLAPEVLRGAHPDDRADLYALGVTLRELGPGLCEPWSPADLDLIARLTSEDLARRPSSAAEVLELWGMGALPSAPVRAVPRRLVGRHQELGLLSGALDALEDTRRGARSWSITGPAGVGKSRLLRELAWLAQPRMRVVEGFARPGLDARAALERAALCEIPARGALAAIAASERMRGREEVLLLIVDSFSDLPAHEREAVAALSRLTRDDDPWMLLTTDREGPTPGASEIRLGPLGEGELTVWLADTGASTSVKEALRATGGLPADLVMLGHPGPASGAGETGLAPPDGADAREALARVLALAPSAAERELTLLGVEEAALLHLAERGFIVKREDGWTLARPAAADELARGVPMAAAFAALAEVREREIAALVRGSEREGLVSADLARCRALAGHVDAALALARRFAATVDREPAVWRAAARAIAAAATTPRDRVAASDLLRRTGAAGEARSILERCVPELAPGERAEALVAALACAVECDDAAGALADAERYAPELAEPETSAAVAHWVARARIRLGDHDRARSAAESALTLTRDSSTLADLHEDLGIAASYAGDHPAARVHLAMAAGLHRDRRAPRRILRAVSYQAIDAYRSGDAAAAALGHKQALGIAEEHGLSDQIARASLNHGTACHARGELGAALAAYDRGLAMATALGQAELEVILGFNLAKLYADAGAFDRAAQRAEAARAAAAAREMRFFVAAAESVLGDCALSRGRHDEAGAAFERARAEFGAAGALREALEEELELARAAWARADYSRASAIVERARRGDLLPGAADLGARAAVLASRVAQAAGGHGAALAEAELAARLAAEAGRPDLAAEAHVAQADALVALGRPGDAEDRLARARRAWADMAETLPAAMRDAFHAHPRRRDLRATPEAAASRAPGLATPVGRLVGLFRKLNSSLETAEVLAMAIDAAIDLTNAERGFVVLRGADGALRVPVARNLDRERVGKSHLKFSRSIAEQAMETEGPIVTVDAQSDERFRENASVHAMRLRSVLAVPIRSPDGVLGALYVDNRLGRDRFRPDDVELLLAFADQVALALRNAALVAELRRRSEELEVERGRIAEIARDQAAEIERLAEAVKVRQEALEHRFDYGAIIGRSPALRRVFSVLDRVVDAPVTVLVTGESGTGKELVARAVHFAGSRKEGPFVGINCAALPAALLESELFGHVRGAFTGADKDRTGLMVSARGGTLFLDELGEMPLDVQAKLLRVLQEREVRPVGSERATPVDFRLVCATNRRLAEEVARGRFREDLYFRVAVIEIELPALRDRLEDLPDLIAHFVDRAAEGLGREPPRVSAAALRALASHRFPGNVRELENVVTRAVVLCDRGEISVEDLGLAPPRVRAARATGDERRAYRDALERAGWNVVAAARELGVPRATFYRRLDRLGLRRPPGAGRGARA